MTPTAPLSTIRFASFVVATLLGSARSTLEHVNQITDWHASLVSQATDLYKNGLHEFTGKQKIKNTTDLGDLMHEGISGEKEALRRWKLNHSKLL